MWVIDWMGSGLDIMNGMLVVSSYTQRMCLTHSGCVIVELDIRVSGNAKTHTVAFIIYLLRLRLRTYCKESHSFIDFLRRENQLSS